MINLQIVIVDNDLPGNDTYCQSVHGLWLHIVWYDSVTDNVRQDL